MCTLTYKNKLWMVNEKGEPVFGDGIAELIEAIEQYHSILEAAEHLNMSYRYALHRITLAEGRLGEALVTRVRGGAKGGGSSEVTEYGKDLTRRFRKSQEELEIFMGKLS
jgi:molybdate transport system regulatory protein